jgi:hypothetical protein
VRQWFDAICGSYSVAHVAIPVPGIGVVCACGTIGRTWYRVHLGVGFRRSRVTSEDTPQARSSSHGSRRLRLVRFQQLVVKTAARPSYLPPGSRPPEPEPLLNGNHLDATQRMASFDGPATFSSLLESEGATCVTWARPIPTLSWPKRRPTPAATPRGPPSVDRRGLASC